MSTTYKIISGDTFAKISQKTFGEESKATLIQQSNPGFAEPLPVGGYLSIPMAEDTPQITSANTPDEVSLTILNKRFRFWDSVTLTRSIDSVDTLELTAPFEPSNADFRDAFRPFSYQPVTLSIGSELVFTGTQILPKPSSSPQGRAVAVAAYSLPGVLVDCCAPAGMYSEDDSLEFESMDLKGIATKVLAPFGLTPVFEGPVGKAFELVALKATEEILPFLAKLAKQRALVITSNVKGEIIFWQSNLGGNPVAILRDNVPGPVLSIDPDFKAQQYYSHITGLNPTSLGDSGGQLTVVNKQLKGVLRPFTFEVTDAEADNQTLETATRSKTGRMFGDAITYSVELNTWRDSKGALWAPNTTVIVEAPNVMIYKPYEFLIRDVKYHRDSSGATATLVLVLPAAYRGEIPETMPWDF